MLLYPFYIMTKAVSITQEPIIQSAWFVYNHLFTHLETFGKKIRRNKNNHLLMEAIKAGTAKFSDYYSKTDNSFGDYFGITALLNPSIRTNAYSLDHWSLKEKELYINKAKLYYKQNYNQYEKERPQTQCLSQSSALVSNHQLPLPLCHLMDINQFSQNLNNLAIGYSIHNLSHQQDEFSQYLQDTPTISNNRGILVIWKDLEATYPVVARMARDLLAIPLSGVGVERKFNIARDVCHYRRGHLKGKTIEEIMLLKIANQQYYMDLIHQETNKGVSSDMDHQEWSIDDEIAKKLLSDFLN